MTMNNTQEPAGQVLGAASGSVSLRARIAELEEELARAKRMAHCPHDPKPGIGGAIQRLRQREELSINQLAEASGVSKGQISRLEREDDPNVEIHTLRKLVIPLGSSLSEIFAAVEAEEQNDVVSHEHGEDNAPKQQKA